MWTTSRTKWWKIMNLIDFNFSQFTFFTRLLPFCFIQGFYTFIVPKCVLRTAAMSFLQSITKSWLLGQEHWSSDHFYPQTEHYDTTTLFQKMFHTSLTWVAPILMMNSAFITKNLGEGGNNNRLFWMMLCVLVLFQIVNLSLRTSPLSNKLLQVG